VELIISWLGQGEYRAFTVFIIATFSVFILGYRTLLIIKSRKVSVGGDNNGIIINGGIKSHKQKSMLTTIAEVSTVLALVTALFVGYISYQTLTHSGGSLELNEGK